MGSAVFLLLGSFGWVDKGVKGEKVMRAGRGGLLMVERGYF